jgi:hypothetical protein
MFWEYIVYFKLYKYLEYSIPKLPLHFPVNHPDFQQSQALLFSMIMALFGDQRSLQDSGQLKTGLLLYGNTLALQKTLHMVIPPGCSFVAAETINRTSLKHATWNLDWAFRSHIFQSLDLTAKSNALIPEPNGSALIPCWLMFACLAFFIPPRSAYRDIYLNIMDDLTRYAIVSAPILNTSPCDSQSQFSTGLDIFLRHISQLSPDDRNETDFELLREVSSKVFARSGRPQSELLDYIDVLQEPPQSKVTQFPGSCKREHDMNEEKNHKRIRTEIP